MFFKIVLVIATAVFFVSCSKDTVGPTIEVLKPVKQIINTKKNDTTFYSYDIQGRLTEIFTNYSQLNYKEKSVYNYGNNEVNIKYYGNDILNIEVIVDTLKNGRAVRYIQNGDTIVCEYDNQGYNIKNITGTSKDSLEYLNGNCIKKIDLSKTYIMEYYTDKKNTLNTTTIENYYAYADFIHQGMFGKLNSNLIKKVTKTYSDNTTYVADFSYTLNSSNYATQYTIIEKQTSNSKDTVIFDVVY